jgi:CRP/FNR family transcriptional regulator, cyclic AMP receptor protein
LTCVKFDRLEESEMADELAERLAKVDLFAGFSRKSLQRLSRSGREVKHQPGHEVASEGGGAAGFHLILEGHCHVEVGGLARSDLGPGDHFGEISLVDGKPRSATVRAGDDGVRTFAIPVWEFRALLDEHPELTRALLDNLCARIRSIEASIQPASSD